MRLDEYAFGIRHDSPGLRAPPKPTTFKQWTCTGPAQRLSIRRCAL